DEVVSITTVRSHIRSLLSKLGVHSQIAAIGLARNAGWEPPAEG
ncbi:MAG: DNA-binding response regulator, partial [Actinobacteria bacterium QS_5_72_10]